MPKLLMMQVDSCAECPNQTVKRTGPGTEGLIYICKETKEEIEDASDIFNSKNFGDQCPLEDWEL